jgi:peptidoglycan/xylan/chitin deacetylase (PgdA/CDA1 family)
MALAAAGSYVGINFHGIGEPHAGVPADERPYWLGTARFARVIARIAALRDAGRDIRITFDDGNASDLLLAAPVLAQHGLTGAFFVLTGRFDDPHYLSQAQVRELLALGHEIGLHGRDHVDWRTLDDATLDAETQGARDVLAAVAGAPVTSVAIPFGAYDRRVMARLKSAGFSAIHTSDGGQAQGDAQVRPRTSLRSDMDDARIEAILAGADPPVKRLRRTVSMWRRGGL